MSSEAIAYQKAHIDDDKRLSLIITMAVFLCAALAAAALRLMARKITNAGLKIDDWMLLVGLIFTIAFVIDNFLGIPEGLGRHSILTPDQTSHIKNTLADEALYNPAIGTIKFSILLLYRRIFPIPRFHRYLYGVGAFILCYTTTATIVAIFQCVPVEANWNPTLDHTCVNIVVALTIFGAINTTTDAVILILPMPLLWNLHTSRAQKLQLTGMFLTGGFVIIISVVRVVYIYAIKLEDPTWTECESTRWSVAEVCVAVVCACLPTLRPLFNRKKKNTIHNHNSKKSSSSMGQSLPISRPPPAAGSNDEIPLTSIEDGWYTSGEDKGGARTAHTGDI